MEPGSKKLGGKHLTWGFTFIRLLRFKLRKQFIFLSYYLSLRSKIYDGNSELMFMTHTCWEKEQFHIRYMEFLQHLGLSVNFVKELHC